jgi:3-hydroxyisobutyrate dehydrogenase-like beta-hydroxyacid dehydrogenase
LFGVDLARKDAGHALDLAKASGSELTSAALVDEHLKVVKEVKGEKGNLLLVIFLRIMYSWF